MDVMRIEILNPKALQLIEGMQNLNLIKITEEPKTRSVPENEEALWRDLSTRNFLKGYAENEPEYTEADIKEPNPEYKAWKGK